MGYTTLEDENKSNLPLQGLHEKLPMSNLVAGWTGRKIFFWDILITAAWSYATCLENLRYAYDQLLEIL